MFIVYWNTATLLSGTPTNPSPAQLSANQITLPFCSCLHICRNWNEKHPQDNSMLVGPIGRYTTGLFWSRGLGHVLGSVWWQHRGVLRYCNVFHQEVCRSRSIQKKTIRIYPNQKPWINSDVTAALSVRTFTFKSGNIGDRKQASYYLRKSIKAAKQQQKN